MEMQTISSRAGWKPSAPQDRASVAPSFELVDPPQPGPGDAPREERRSSLSLGPEEPAAGAAAGAAGANWCWLAGVALGTSMVLLGSLVAIYWADGRPATPHLPHAPNAGQPVVLEINTRAWLYALAQRGEGIPVNCSQYVCLKDVPDAEWQKLRDDHVDFVWLMGIWQLGQVGLEENWRMMDRWQKVLPDATKDDVIGSAFSIVSYSVNADIGTAADLAAVRQTLRRLGMKLMLDFVPNHSAKDAMWLSANPGMYLRRPSSDRSPDDPCWKQIGDQVLCCGRGPFDHDVWHDTLQLNYWSAETVEVMSAALYDIASQADAIRVDMAMLLINDVWAHSWGDLMEAAGFRRPAKEFWDVAISKVRKDFPDTVLLAEAYDYGITATPERQLLLQLGFDFVYGQTVYSNLVQAKGAGDLSQLAKYVSRQAQSELRTGSHFVENHDQPRAAAAFGGQQQAFVAAVIASTLPGMRLFHFGQFDGLSQHLQGQLRRAVPEEPSPAVHRQFSLLLAALADPVFREGKWSFVTIPVKAMVAWRWSYRNARRLVVANFGEQEAAAAVQLPDAVGQGGGDGLHVTDLLTGAASPQSAVQMRGSGLRCTLGPWTAQILDYGQTPVETAARHSAGPRHIKVAV